MPRVHCVVKGRVQGVGFRFFVQDEGRRLGLSGWVRNLPGGEVELEASGKSEALSELVEIVQRGPTLARVLDVQTEWGEGDLRKGDDSWGYYRF